MIIHTAKSRKSTEWIRKDISFYDLIQRLNKPTITDETYSEYMSYSKDKQDELKDVGGYIGGILRNNKRTKKSVLKRTLVTLDADNIKDEKQLNDLLQKLEKSGYSYCWHTTRKHSPESPRIRIIFPLDGSIEPKYYEPVVRGLCYQFGMEMFDRTCVQYNRFMYFTSCCIDSEFRLGYRIDGENLNADKFLFETYYDWNDISQWKKFPNEEDIAKESAIKAGDPREKDGDIGIFCRAYPISEAIETFLSDVYAPGDTPNRYSFIGGTSSNGLVVYNDLQAYSYHESDPANNGHCNNAYDLVRIQKFGDTKTSTTQMFQLMENDEKFKRQRLLETREAFKDVELSDVEDDNLALLDQALERTGKGVIKTTIDNFYQILTLDPRLYDKYYFDMFANKKIVAKPLPWHNDKETLPRLWRDSDDAGLRHYIEKNYSVKNNTALSDATDLAFNQKMIHPVREYLNTLIWDGIPRVDTLLVDYFGAENNVYTREAIYKTLLAAVMRIYQPGTKFDNVLILKGRQGTGKSTFVRILASDEWFSDSLTRFDGKEASELLENKWLIELGELKGLYRKEIEQAKQFFSKTSDQYRAAYARHPEEHPRQCVFIGTTNNETFLTDRTGNRRFWPIELGVNMPFKSVFKDLENERDQIWAEVKTRYDEIKKDKKRLKHELILSDEARKLAEIEQENRLEDDPRIGEIISFILREVPVGWNKYSLEERINYWNNETIRDENSVETEQRDRICPLEIIKELYQLNMPDKRLSTEISTSMQTIPGLKKFSKLQRFGRPYSHQRGYEVTSEFFKTFHEN